MTHLGFGSHVDPQEGLTGVIEQEGDLALFCCESLV